MNQFDPLQDSSISTPVSRVPSDEQWLFDAAGLELPSNGAPGPARRARRKLPRAGRAASGVKNFVLDTNVLLHDPYCIQRFDDNHVWIPVDVLSELDRFKNEQSERGANARAVHRLLTKAFADGGDSVTSGVATPGGGTMRLAVFDWTGAGGTPAALRKFLRIFPEPERVDHRIIASAILLQAREKEPAILVTKDLNMQLKARAVGIHCEDYLNDKVEAKDVENYELKRLAVEATEMQRFASSGEIALGESRLAGLAVNEYVLLESTNGKTMPARLYADGILRRLIIPEFLHVPKGTDIRPVNLGQQCFIDALLDPGLSLVTCYGQAGTGKTLLAVAAGLSAVYARDFSGLTVSRPVVAMGDTLGFLPGDLEQKMRPWLQPIYDALEVVFPPPGLHGASGAQQGAGRKAGKRQKNHDHDKPADAHHGRLGRKAYDHLIENGTVEIEALCYIRGRSIPRRFFVLDEAQQLTPLEAKTLVTRMSKGSKLVMVGDPAQIDNPYVDSRSNGLVYTRNRLRGHAIAAHVTLHKGERSDLAELGAKFM